MNCPNCGKEIANDSVFCEFCGVKISKDSSHIIKNKPLRPTLCSERKVFLGVCAGEGEYYAMYWGGNPNTWTIVCRVIYAVTSLFFGIGLIVYLIVYLIYKYINGRKM